MPHDSCWADACQALGIGAKSNAAAIMLAKAKASSRLDRARRATDACRIAFICIFIATSPYVHIVFHIKPTTESLNLSGWRQEGVEIKWTELLSPNTQK